jgi:putative membrane protein
MIELNYLVAKANITVAFAVSVFTLLGFFIGLMTALTAVLFRKFRRKKKLKLSAPVTNS